jgi:hypothetical protein
MPTGLLIVGGQLIALALYFLAHRFWINNDVQEFNLQGGTKDDNHQTFHRQRLSWRIAFDVLVALLCSTPLLKGGGPTPFWVVSIGLASIGAGYFFYYFNPGLSLARGLDYVKQYYVSFDPRASWWPDRFLANRAIKALPAHGGDDATLDTDRRAYAARELQLLLRLVLCLGSGVYLIGLVLAYWLA